MISSSQLNKNLYFVKSKIQKAAQQSGRKASEITIVAVTKTLSFEAWNKALELKLTTIGESRILEVENKTKEFNHRNQIELHLIGHLQSNKVRKAINLFDIIQTIDSIKLLRRINQISQQENKKQKIFLQVNTGKDPQKHGFKEHEVFITAQETTKMSNIILNGIMTIPPQKETETKLTAIYNKTRKIKDKIQQSIERECKYLSMGMSRDFETAIKEGATHIRIGTMLFGDRPETC